MKMLIVDDDPTYRELMVAYAKQLSVKVAVFSDRDSAYQYFNLYPNEFQWAIIDFMLPGRETGLALAEDIKELNDDISILIVSHYNPPSTACVGTRNIPDPFMDRVNKIGRFLRKPALPNTIKLSIETLLHRQFVSPL